jgi:hypothetical protein
MIKNFFLREKLFKNIPNKGYCVQTGRQGGLNFTYSIFDFSVKVLDDTRYFGIYFTLFGSLLNINIDWTRKTDHAGFNFDFNLLWLLIHATVYDTRHWDHEKEDWCKYD